jgi:hypothetical protein
MGPIHPNWGERHYRQLSKLKAYELRVAALLEIQTRFGNKPTEGQVREVIEELWGWSSPTDPAWVSLDKERAVQLKSKR